MLNSPGGCGRVFERAPTTIDEAVAALLAYGCEPAGPNPREMR